MAQPALSASPARLVSMDAFRGFVMFLMMAEVLRLSRVASATESRFWDVVAWHQSHVAWYGLSLHDLIPWMLPREVSWPRPAWLHRALYRNAVRSSARRASVIVTLSEASRRDIAARSPEAKGRIERHWQTLQDRLTAEFALHGIHSPEAAAPFLPRFLERYRTWFGKAPRNPASAW